MPLLCPPYIYICLQFKRNSPRGHKRNKRYYSKFHMGMKNSKNCPKHTNKEYKATGTKTMPLSNKGQST